MKKLIRTADLRKALDSYNRAEISYSRMVEMLNEDANKALNLPVVSKSFNREGELLQYIYTIMPFAIKPKVERKYKLINPFTSNHAFEQVCKHLAKKLFNVC